MLPTQSVTYVFMLKFSEQVNNTNSPVINHFFHFALFIMAILLRESPRDVKHIPSI